MDLWLLTTDIFTHDEVENLLKQFIIACQPDLREKVIHLLYDPPVQILLLLPNLHTKHNGWH